MKKTYYLTALGYTIHPQDPGFPTLTEAREQLATLVREEKEEAKNRWKSVAVIRDGKDRVAIHATKDKQSPCWGEYEIVEG